MNALRKMVKRAVTGSLLGIGVAASSIALAHDTRAAGSENHEILYDPAACKTDAQGKIYIALGRNVFAFSTSGTMIVARYGDAWPMPPDQTDLVGCPGNPAQMSDYSFPYSFDGSVTKKPGEFAPLPQADLLQLISIHGNSATSSRDDTEWRGESVELSLAQSVCGKAVAASADVTVIREELPNGFTACREQHEGVANRIEEQRATYIARPETYKTPLGKPFVVNCDNQVATVPGEHCDVDYVFGPGLGVNYQFQPDQTSRALPIDQIIAFDRGLRAAINATLVKDYRWREQTAGTAD